MRINRIMKFLDNARDILKKKLAEKEYISIRNYLFMVFELTRIIYSMYFVVSVITSFWMHYSLEMKA